MPENAHLMADLERRYGDQAEAIYWGMVGEAKGPFSQSGKYHHEHVAWAKKQGVTPISTTRAKKKPRKR